MTVLVESVGRRVGALARSIFLLIMSNTEMLVWQRARPQPEEASPSGLRTVANFIGVCQNHGLVGSWQVLAKLTEALFGRLPGRDERDLEVSLGTSMILSRCLSKPRNTRLGVTRHSTRYAHHVQLA